MKKKDTNLYLVCEVCSFNGSRVTPDCYIAIIDKIQFPFTKEYCKHLYYDRGFTEAFFGTDWQSYKCPKGNHSIFVLTNKDMTEFKKYGITRILTSEGWKYMDTINCQNVEISKVENVDDAFEMSVAMRDDVSVINKLSKETTKDVGHGGTLLARCKICGSLYANRDVCLKHVKRKHPEEPEPSKYVEMVVKYVR